MQVWYKSNSKEKSIYS